jgi:hypothetical protein
VQFVASREDRIRTRLTRPATAAEITHLRRHILIALDTRATFEKSYPKIPPIADVTVLGIALAQWLGGEPAEVVAALGGSPDGNPAPDA